MFVFICIYLFTNARPILDSEGMGAFFGHIFQFQKKGILLAHTPDKQMPFLSVFDIFIRYISQQEIN